MGAIDSFLAINKNEKKIGDFLPFGSQVSSTVIKNTDGRYLSTIKLAGIPFTSAMNRELNSYHMLLNSTLATIAQTPGTSVWVNTVRRLVHDYPEGEFQEGFAKDLNEKYKESFTTKGRYVNEIYLTILYLPETISINRLISKYRKISKSEIARQQKQAIEILEELTQSTAISLDAYEPDILGCYTRKKTGKVLFTEPQEFLSLLWNGDFQRVSVQPKEVRYAIPRNRVIFGKGGNGAIAGTCQKNISMVGIDNYPAKTWPGILDDLLKVRFELTITHTFDFLPKAVAMGRLKRQHGRLVESGDVAKSQINAIEGAMDDLESNRFCFGVHSSSIAVKADSINQLNTNTSHVTTILSDAGISSEKLDIAAWSAYLTQLPGNYKYRHRTADITSRNLAALVSFHNYPIGSLSNNQWGPAVTVLETDGGTPHYFNFHVTDGSSGKDKKFDPSHRDVASAVVFGKPGTGKTVLQNFLLCQSQKFHGVNYHRQLSGLMVPEMTSVVFDKDYGSMGMVWALGGKYFPIKNSEPTGFAPLQLPKEHDEFVHRLIIALCERRAGFKLSPVHEGQLQTAIDTIRSSKYKQNRQLRRLGDMLNQNDPTGPYQALKPWINDGPYAWVFDNPEDTLDIDNVPVVGFDITKFLDNPVVRGPIIAYLFERMNKLFDNGRRVPIFMDEFWKLLGDDSFSELIADRLATARKLDSFLFLSTQSPRPVLDHKAAFAVLEHTAQQIFLPNPGANDKDYIDGLNLTEKEFDTVRSMPKKSRKMLIRRMGEGEGASSSHSSVCQLNLTGFESELAVMSGNSQSTKMLFDIYEEFGTDPKIWIPEFHRRRGGKILPDDEEDEQDE